MAAKNKQFDLKTISAPLINSVTNSLQKMGNISFSKDPEVAEKEILEYESRLRTHGLSKFNGPCYVSSVSFYLSAKALEDHEAIGVFVLYFEYDAAAKILKAAGFKDVNDEDEDSVLEKSAELCKLIAGHLKTELTNLVGKELVTSEPLKGKNEIFEGVEFSYDEYKYFEAGFYLWKQKAIVADLSIASL